MIQYATTRNGKPTPFGVHGKLHVEGAHLIDEHGEICQLRGLSSHNISSFPEYINKDTITELADRFHLDLFRFAMYSAYADEVMGYADGDDAHKEELEKLLLDTVKITAELGIYLIVDWHTLLDYDPNIHCPKALKFFEKICPLLKDYDHIIYEICNEPNLDCPWDAVCNYADQVIPLIQGIDNTKVIIVGTPVWSQRVDEPVRRPLHYNNIMYTFHFYADTHRDELRELVKDSFDNHNLPIFVTEFGICDASGNGPVNEEQTKLWIDLLDERKISYVLWNLSNKSETSAILIPGCKKITGFEDSDFTPSGKFLANMIPV